MPDQDPQTIRELAQVRAELGMLMRMVQESSAHQAKLIQQGIDSTNARINDLRLAMDAQHRSLGERVGVLERNERDTAVKASALGALAGIVTAITVAAATAFFKR